MATEPVTTSALAAIAGVRPDLLVVGAGPAGAAAALHAAALGARVMLVDRARFPRAKVCGGCLSPAGVALLESIPGAPGVRPMGVPLSSLRVHVAGRSASLELAPGGIAVDRAALDHAMVASCRRAGVEIVDGVRARLVATDLAGADVSMERGDEVATFRVPRVIAADGLTGSFLPRTTPFISRAAPGARVGVGAVLQNIDEAACPPGGVVSMHCAEGGYVGMVRLRDGRVDVAAALDPSLVRHARGAGRAVTDIVHRAAGVRCERLEQAHWAGTGELTRARCVEHATVLCAGDAAGYVEPFTGEGMSWAIRAGMLAARCAVEGAPGDWARVYRREIVPAKRRCRIVTRLLRSPTLLRTGVAAISAAPILAAGVRAMLAGPWDSGRRGACA